MVHILEVVPFSLVLFVIQLWEPWQRINCENAGGTCNYIEEIIARMLVV